MVSFRPFRTSAPAPSPEARNRPGFLCRGRVPEPPNPDTANNVPMTRPAFIWTPDLARPPPSLSTTRTRAMATATPVRRKTTRGPFPQGLQDCTARLRQKPWLAHPHTHAHLNSRQGRSVALPGESQPGSKNPDFKTQPEQLGTRARTRLRANGPREGTQPWACALCLRVATWAGFSAPLRMDDSSPPLPSMGNSRFCALSSVLGLQDPYFHKHNKTHPTFI